MRISDWSSDVCSSDLIRDLPSWLSRCRSPKLSPNCGAAHGYALRININGSIMPHMVREAGQIDITDVISAEAGLAIRCRLAPASPWLAVFLDFVQFRRLIPNIPFGLSSNNNINK